MSALAAADDTLSGWLEGLVTGEGSSPSQIIITGILGVIPGVGQALDVRDLIKDIIALSKSATDAAAWLSMLITLIGFIPVMGDALKTFFKLAKSGKGLSRSMDSITGDLLKGDIKKWVTHINWGQIAQSAKSTLNDILDVFIDGLDSWLAQVVMGKAECRNIIAQVKNIKTQAPKMLDEAIEELKTLHKSMLGEPLPKSTATVSHGSRTPAVPSNSAKVETSTKKIAQDNTPNNPVQVNANNPKNHRGETKQESKYVSGVPAEHLTDYWVNQHKTNLKKANYHGRLIPDYGSSGRTGIDHLWAQKGASNRPGIVAETKSSLLGSIAFISALPADIQAKFKALGDTEAAERETLNTKNKEKNAGPTMDNAGRDDIGTKKVKMDSSADENNLKGRGGLNETKTKGTQMSHKWIVDSLVKDMTLTTAGIEVKKKASNWWKNDYFKGVNPPYARWLVMVSGRQLSQHSKVRKLPSHKHDIQDPLITLPDNILSK